MRMLILLIVMTVILLISSASSQDRKNPPATEITNSTSKIRQLQNERVATLRQVVDISERLARNARIEMFDVVEARMSLLSAELDVATQESDRIALYRKALQSLQEYFDLAKKQFEASAGTELYMLTIKAKRLEIEVLLEQAKIKEAQESR